jgi:hypothetical protein
MASAGVSRTLRLRGSRGNNGETNLKAPFINGAYRNRGQIGARS